MNFLSIEYFIAVTENDTITKAAEQLYITQQTLSTHIASLENELGSKLFIRSNPIELTYAGKIFLKHVSDIYERYNIMWNEMHDVTDKEVGNLHIGVDYAISSHIMPQLIELFRREYPNTDFTIVESNSEALHENLTNKRIDIAIGILSKPAMNIKTKDFYQDSLVMVVPNIIIEKNNIPTDNLCVENLNEFKQFPFILSHSNNISTQIIQKIINKYDFQPIIKAKSDNIKTRLSLCANGVGICFSPQMYLNKLLSEEEKSKVTVFQLREDTRYTISFGYRKDPYQWKMASEFIRIATSHSLHF